MDLAGLSAAFAENFSGEEELGASVAIWNNGQEVLSLGRGFQNREKTIPWTSQSRVLIWSATKGLTSGCLLHACRQHRISITETVKRFWPEYARAGKDGTTLQQILSHQAGMPALRDSTIPVLDRSAVVGALAAQEPFWAPGKAHGYHARTFGFLVDELLRRITGGTGVSAYFRQIFGDPLNLDLWIGIPSALAGEVAPIYAPRHNRTSPEEAPFYAQYAQPHSLTRQAFSTPAGLEVPSLMNDPAIRQMALPSFGGIGTAESLCRFYHALCEPDILEEPALCRGLVVTGIDRVLRISTGFSAGFMKDPVAATRKERKLFGPSLQAFGQPGAGGSHAFADPENRITFAYVMNQMEPGVLPNRKSLRLVEFLYADGE